jgi:NAD-dependent dihydropyrimidine dehydrogenase PreA subunit
MTFFVTDNCLDVLDRSCIDECPMDCIYEGDRKMYINPRECIDCGACEPVCPVSAILSDLHPSERDRVWSEDNAAFFATVLPGRDAALGSPGGAAALGRIGVDTPLASGSPAVPR